MSDMSDVRIYKKNDIEKFIKELENKKDYDFKRVFEKAGAFLGESYIIYSTSNSFYKEVCPLKALQKFIKNKFDEYFDDDIMEDFEKLHYTSLTTEIKKDDFAKEIIPEIESSFEEIFFKYKDSFLFRYKILLTLEFEDEQVSLGNRTYRHEFYIENIKKTSYYEDDFTPEEWQTLLNVINPINLSLASFDNEGEEENAFAEGVERNNRTKENIGKRDDRKGTTTDLNKASKSETLDGEEVQISEHKEELKEVVPEVKKEQPKEEINPVDIIQEIAKTIRPEKQGTVAQNVQSYTELTEVIDEKEDMF